MPTTLGWRKEQANNEDGGSGSANADGLGENKPRDAGRPPTPSAAVPSGGRAMIKDVLVVADSTAGSTTSSMGSSTVHDDGSGGSTPVGDSTPTGCTPDPSPRAAAFPVHGGGAGPSPPQQEAAQSSSSSPRDPSPSPPRLDWSRTSQGSGTGSSMGSSSGSLDSSRRSEADQQAATRAALLRQKLADVHRKVNTTLASPTASSSGAHDSFRTSSTGNSLNGGSGAAAKKAMQKVKSTIMFAGKRQMLLPKQERDQLVSKWGIDRVDTVEEEALLLFSSLDGSQAAADGELQLADFQQCLGAMGGSCVSSELPVVLFSAIDKDGNGTISFGELVLWLLTVTHGTEEEKLRYGFDLCDQNKDGTIDKRDLTTTIENMFKVLTGLNLPSHDICVRRFVDTVFTRLSQHALRPEVVREGEGISWETFKAGSKSIATFLRTLGSRDVSCYHTPCSRSRNKAATVVFGSPKWKFITNMVRL